MGQIVVTSAAMERLGENEALLAIARHMTGDWGDLPEEAWERNEDNLQEGSQVSSMYHDKDGEPFFVVTEHDRSATTVRLPSDA